jgi:FKBP-type peptidyl-prolyl cis-trans isomerase
MNENLIWSAYAVSSLVLIVFVYVQIKKRVQKVSVANLSQPLIRTEQTESGVQSDILQEGRGPGAKKNDSLTVQYIAWLSTGEKVDSSYDRGRSLTFALGRGEVIDGWDHSLFGIQLGEKRRVTVPAKLAYGKKGHSKIPPNATVVFEIELIGLN